jgi:hypothetical protein
MINVFLTRTAWAGLIYLTAFVRSLLFGWAP